MLGELIVAHRDEIIANARARVEARQSPKASETELTSGIPLFLDQLAEALRRSRFRDVADDHALGQSATLHARALVGMGLPVAQVVHDYGDICQAVTEVALGRGLRVPTEDFKSLNLCLDDAIASAVTEFGELRARAITEHGTERLGFLAHEMRNLLSTAMLSFEAISSGRLSLDSSTGRLHQRSLIGLRDLIDRSLAEVRLDAGVNHRAAISVAEFVEEAEVVFLLQARTGGVGLSVTLPDPSVTIEGDRQILAGALGNLLQNALKFTHKPGTVSLRAVATPDRVLFEVEDECGGLPPGNPAALFLPYAQRDGDRSGLGLGLSICLKAAKAHQGEIRVRDLPGKGCVFTLDLPRRSVEHLPA